MFKKLNKKNFIEKVYDEELEFIENKMNSNSTTNSEQLNNIGKEILGFKFNGVYSNDNVPVLTDSQPYAIVNTHSSKQAGEHWIAIVKVKGYNKCLFYDSYGRNYNKIMPLSFFKKGFKIINTENDAEQGILEKNCGQRCLSFLVCYDRYGYTFCKLI